jgi:hypothetical protein
MSNSLSIAPVIVNVVGANAGERKLSVLANHPAASTMLALSNAKGAIGKAARNGAAIAGLEQIAGHAARGNYRPLGEYLAAQLGETIVISGRAMFEALPDMFEMRIAKIKLTKSGGYREDKKTGAQVPNATLTLALQLKAVCVEMVAAAAAHHAAQAKAKEAEQAAITQ